MKNPTLNDQNPVSKSNEPGMKWSTPRIEEFKLSEITEGKASNQTQESPTTTSIGPS